MALRHLIPHFTVREVDRSVEPVKPPPVMKAPVSVGFRKGAPLTEVVAAVSGNRSVAIDAAASAGKSVTVPPELAKSMSTLVIHSVPSILLAYDLHDHVSTQVSVPTAFVEDCQQDMPTRGIVYTSNAVLVGRLLEKGCISDVPVVLYMDEVHESDAYTYVLRTVAAALPEVKCLVQSTATANVDVGRRRELGGALTEHKYPHTENPKDWDVYDDGKPWSVATIRGNALLFVDSPHIANRLRADYEDCGFHCFIFSARMTVAEYARARVTMKDQSEGISVAVADYSFRSGFTYLDIEKIVDSGDVPYVIEEKGTPRKIYRRAFAGERYQGASRGARAPGTKCDVYMPDDEPKYAICDLEGVEMDAAAVIIRLLGYRVPHALRASRCATGKVPKQICEALRGAQPFGCLSPTLLVDLSQVVVASVDIADSDSAVIDITNPHMSEVSDNATKLMDSTDQTVGDIMMHLQDGMTSLHAVVERIKTQPQFELGSYYMSADVINAPDNSIFFPDGVSSIHRFVQRDDFDFRVTRLPVRDRAYVAKTLFSAYNLATAEYLALRRLSADAPTQHLNNPVVYDIIRDWAVGVLEAVADKVSAIDAYSKIIPRFVSHAIESIAPLVEIELQFAAGHMAKLSDAVADLSEDYKGNYHASLIGAPSTKRAVIEAARGGPCVKAMGNVVQDKSVGFKRMDRLIEDVTSEVEPPDKSRHHHRSRSRHKGRRRSSTDNTYVARVEPKPGGSSVWNHFVKKMVDSTQLMLEPVPVRRSR